MVKTLAAALVVAALCGLMTSAALGQATEVNLACVLLVDDDQDGPDVRIYYTSTLDEMDVTYEVWDVATQGDPSAGDLMGYQMVIWFTGYPRSDTFTSANEAAVATYLDAEGRFWLVSEDYLYDRGLTWQRVGSLQPDTAQRLAGQFVHRRHRQMVRLRSLRTFPLGRYRSDQFYKL